MSARQEAHESQPPARRGRAAGRGRRAVLVAAGLIVVAALAATALLARPAPAAAQACPPGAHDVGTAAGQCAPNFTLDNLRGKPLSLAAFRGRPVMLHFWGVPCPTCAAEYPDFSRAVRTYGQKGVAVLAVEAWQDPAAVVRAWQDQHHLPAVILVDPPGVVDHLYGITGTPTTFFIDRQGRIKSVFASPLTYAQYRHNLSAIM